MAKVALLLEWRTLNGSQTERRNGVVILNRLARIHSSNSLIVADGNLFPNSFSTQMQQRDVNMELPAPQQTLETDQTES